MSGDDSCDSTHADLSCYCGLRGGGASRAVGELAEPQLEHDERPQPMTVIALPLLMLVPESRNARRVEDPAILQPAVEQQLRCQRLERPAQPVGNRRGEAVLGAVENRARHAPLEALGEAGTC